MTFANPIPPVLRALDVELDVRATVDEARRAKAALRGFTEDGGHCVRVNVSAIDESVRAAVPAQVEGVPVVLEAVGDITPRR